MPPRKATKKPGKRTIALAKAALDDSPSREDVEMSDMMHLWEAEETVAQMTSEMKKKGQMHPLSVLCAGVVLSGCGNV